MAFYLRKAFKAGPVRLNLSKGGLGLSAGVTGARVGVNTRGTYVHGGRHGMYYRKYAKKGGIPGRNKGDQGSKRSSGPVDLFHDTGVTFPSRSAELRKTDRQEPSLPSSELLTMPVKAGLGGAALLFLFAFATETGWLAILSIILACSSLAGVGINAYWKREAKKILDETVMEVETNAALPPADIPGNHKRPAHWRTWLHLHLHAVVAELAMRREEVDTLSTLEGLDKHFPADGDRIEHIRASILGNLLDEMLEDHILDKEEEAAIRQLIDQLKLPESLIAGEAERLDHYSQIRKSIERPITEIDPGIPLVRGEKAYEIFENVRILKERVFNRFQRDTIRYRELGYEIDLEGKLILTDRRMVLVGRGSREYRNNRVLDITADPEAGIVELILSKRKSPILLTVNRPLVLAARLEKIVEMQKTVVSKA